MRRWPFYAVIILLLATNVSRLSFNKALQVWNDPVCAVFFVGQLICWAIAMAIKSSTPAPPASQ